MDADAIVVGAGAAGLAAARALADRLERVILVEARDRIGGRVFSRPIPGHAVPAEFGAEFIHGRAPVTMRLLREAGANAVAIGGESWVYARDGKLKSEKDDFLSAAALFERARSIPDDESVEHFLAHLQRSEATQKQVELTRAFVEGFDAADPAIASVRAIAEEWRSGVDKTSSRPVGGYIPLFNHLRNACAAAGVKLCLSTAVRRIRWGDREVAIEATDALGQAETIRARVAVVTLPAGVLRRRGDEAAVIFDPELPPAKRAALQSIEMGHVVKIVLWFRTAFWERLENGRYRNAAFFRCEGRPFASYWTQLPMRSELIVAWAGGPKAEALRGAAPEDLVVRARRGFGEILGEPALTQDEFEGGLMHDWNHDAFSQGAYSYVAVGGGGARAALGAPAGALFFAGEATATNGQGGTVNGALETGQRAAAQVLGALATP